jgi:phospholipid-binding lipoprotein MlaA
VANIYPITSFFRALLLALAVTAFSSTSWALDVTDLDVDTPVAKQSVESAALESANEEPKLIAAKDKSGSDDVNDPIESFNRGIFAFNEFFLEYILKPITKGYKAILPDPLEQAIGNALHNVRTPIILLHDLLQGEWERASITSRRFLMNTTLGLGGLIDLADHAGMPAHKEDFGQTLAVWGIPEGPYLVIPLLGPSNPRDLIGRIADGYIDPVSMLANNTGHEEGNYVRMGLTAVNEYRSVMGELEEIKKTSIDYYASIRSLYRQKREAEIRNGKKQKLPPIPDFLSYDYEEPQVGQPVNAGPNPGLIYIENQEISNRVETAQ